MRFQPGKDGATMADVLAAGQAHPEDPLAWVRGVVGDTKPTRDAIAANLAARRNLGCRIP